MAEWGAKKVKYITNKELLGEIQRSKATYCYFLAPEYIIYDAVVTNTEDLTPDFLAATLQTKLTRLSKLQMATDAITTADVVFRVMSDQHLPEEFDEKRRRRSSGGGWVPRTNFPPFQHFVLHGDLLIEVGRSHWTGDLDTGHFSTGHGRMTERLAGMFLLLVEQYSRRGNWRGYSYVLDMRGQALVQLSQVGLQFDESRSDNPFAWYTQIIKNCLAGDVLILTREFGAVPIEEVAEQDVHLLDGKGEWIKCHIYDRGIQETVKLNFYGGFEKISIRATLEHEWIEQGSDHRIESRSFVDHPYRLKDTLIDDLRPAKKIINEMDYRQGVIHGIIYGDGSAAPNCKNFYFMRVCYPKHCLTPWLDDYPKSFARSHNGDPTYYIARAWCNLKALPEQPGKSLDYLLGFLRGWLATDGCVSDEDSPSATLCTDVDEYRWIGQWGPLVGWHALGASAIHTTSDYTQNEQKFNIHLKKHSMNIEDFLNTKHRTRWERSIERPKGWKVYPGARNQKYERQIERVYCPIVDTTHSFALACGIHSGNSFRRTLLLEKRNQDIRDDLLVMHGAMPSYTRQVDDDLEQKALLNETAPVADPETKKEVKKRGRKPKQRDV